MGVNAAFFLDAATYLLSAAFLSSIPLARPRREETEGFGREVKAGIGYLAGAPVPLAIVVGAFLTILTINITIAGDVGYGLLVSVWGGGMVLGSALMAALGDRALLVPLYFLSIFAGALALAGTGLAPTFALALGALMVEGIATGIDNVATDTILQKQVPDAFLGRVFAVRFLSYSAGEALAYPLGGLIVDAIGPRSTYLFAGIATAAAGIVVLIFLTVASER